nr:unnamed protein product [Callosobruchus chinensis]
MQNKIAGCVQTETARRLVEYMDLPITPEECLEKFLSFTRDKLPDCHYMPGKRVLLNIVLLCFFDRPHPVYFTVSDSVIYYYFSCEHSHRNS